MGGGEEPAGLPGAARPAPSTMSACPFVPCFVITPAAHPLLFSTRKKKGGAGRPRAWLKIFEYFFVKFSDAKLSNFRHGLV